MDLDERADDERRHVQKLESLVSRQLEYTVNLVGMFDKLESVIHGQDGRRQLHDLWTAWKDKLSEATAAYQPRP